MKKQLTVLLSLFFLFTVSQGISQAQEKASGKKTEAEVKSKQEEEYKKAQDERKKIEELYKSRVIDAATRRSELAEIERDIHVVAPDLGSGWAVAYPDGNFSIYGGSQDSETLEFRKQVNDRSFTKDFKFTVEESARKVSISVSGSCKKGEIRIKILMPGGKTYTEVLLDEYGSVNWNKSFGIGEEANGKTGDWKFIIDAKEATGTFKLSIKTY